MAWDKNSTRARLKNIWYGMIWRCHKPQHSAYKWYGARGISVCARWHNFDDFIKDMGIEYQQGLTIERSDNTKGYSKENCKWATRTEQANNRKTNRIFTIDGVTKTLAQWIRFHGAKSNVVRQRFYCLGWSIKQSLLGKGV